MYVLFVVYVPFALSIYVSIYLSVNLDSRAEVIKIVTVVQMAECLPVCVYLFLCLSMPVGLQIGGHCSAVDILRKHWTS